MVSAPAGNRGSIWLATLCAIDMEILIRRLDFGGYAKLPLGSRNCSSCPIADLRSPRRACSPASRRGSARERHDRGHCLALQAESGAAPQHIFRRERQFLAHMLRKCALAEAVPEPAAEDAPDIVAIAEGEAHSSSCFKEAYS
jgi:hypothetical protein